VTLPAGLWAFFRFARQLKLSSASQTPSSYVTKIGQLMFHVIDTLHPENEIKHITRVKWPGTEFWSHLTHLTGRHISSIKSVK
jgi:hypothetical protein